MTTGQRLDDDIESLRTRTTGLDVEWSRLVTRVEATERRLTALETPAPTPAPIPALDARLVAVSPFHQGTGKLRLPWPLGDWPTLHQFVLEPSSPRHATLSYRSEMHNNDHVDSFPRRRAYGLTYVIPKDWHLGQTPDPDFWDDRIIFQIHENNGSPVLSLHLNETDNTVSIRRKRDASENLGRWEYFERMPVEFDKPARFRLLIDYGDSGHGTNPGFSAKWGSDEIAYWHNARGLLTTGGSRPYSKWGIYGQPTQLYAGDLKIADGPDALKLVG